MAERLVDVAREAVLRGLSGWRYEADTAAIVKEFQFRDFSEAFGFMTRVALLCQAADHHPDWSNSYKRVTISLTTHSAGGVTENDVKLAEAIEKLVSG